MASVAADFSAPDNMPQVLRDTFAPGDQVGRETMVLLFGNGNEITHCVKPNQFGDETSVEISEQGESRVTQWQISRGDVEVLMGWAHSHHRLTRVPSVHDCKMHYSLQKQAFKTTMLIMNKEGLSAYRLTTEAMALLEPTQGKVPDGTDTMTLVQEITWTRSVDSSLEFVNLEIDNQQRNFLAELEALRLKYDELQASHVKLQLEQTSLKRRFEQMEAREVPAPHDVPAQREVRAGLVGKPIGNGFQQFRAHIKAQAHASVAGKSSSAVVKVVSEQWKSMSEEQKAPFRAEFNALVAAWQQNQAGR